MHKFVLSFLVLIALNNSHVQADFISDLILEPAARKLVPKYGKHQYRCDQVESHIRGTLAESGKDWVLPKRPDCAASKTFFFYPTDISQSQMEPKRATEMFMYYESPPNNPNVLSIDKIWENTKKYYPISSSEPNGRKTVLKRTEDYMVYEIVGRRPVSKIDKGTDENGNIIWEEPEGEQIHIIGEIHQVGGNYFKNYEYVVRGKTLSPEEKKQWFQNIYNARVHF